ncbi:alanine dehydrogenase, partial [Microbacterium gubbeenense]
MRIAVPTEIKPGESRVAITPSGADQLAHRGHEVFVQAGAGDGSRISDDDYAEAGVTILETAEETWAAGELLLKVKEPVQSEYGFLRGDMTLFTYLHLAADRPLTDALLAAGTTAVAYETVQLADGSLPLLTPMSRIAGRLSIVVGAYHLMHTNGGRGSLLGGVPGVPRADVVVIGGGVAGENAAANALGLGARVTVIDVDTQRLADLEARYGNGLVTRQSTRYAIAEAL